jgi:DNA-binding NtrC family response regulator
MKMRRRVLVVDDVQDWRATIEDILNSEYEVITADNYESAMKYIRNREVELVIVDLRLSLTDESDREGMELLKKLAECRINAIVLTGYPEHDMKQEAEEKYEAFDFIDKSDVAGNIQIIRNVVREVFRLLENKEKIKARAIREAKALQSVSFTDDLSSWPLRKFRKGK